MYPEGSCEQTGKQGHKSRSIITVKGCVGMYKDLNYNIETCEYDDQIINEEWCNYVYDATCEILSKFTEEDWQVLFSELPTKSTIWKKRFVDCLGDSENKNELKALMSIALTTDDPELFSLVICTLVDFDLSRVEGTESLFEKVEKMMPEVANYYKNTFAQFLEKKPIDFR